MSPGVEAVPSARRLMHSLRDIGYDLPTAVADIVDNSVDAGAKNVGIDLVHEGEHSWVRIADDGSGMSPKVLDEAMRYGSDRTYRAGELGRFGLGLKTASLSQCRRLTVASRTSVGGRLGIRQWDLDHVARTDAWELTSLTASSAPRSVVEPIRKQPGTVVLWERLDRLVSFSNPDGKRAAAAISKDARRIGAHLGVIFHRFLNGEVKGPKLKLTVNGDQVRSWDPFSRGEDATIVLKRQHVRGDEGTLLAVVRPYILPPQSAFSSREAHEAAAGPRRWNRQQGFYIYRQDRMVQSGGWSRLRTMDEHSKLARIGIDIPAGTEEAWRLNVAKVSASVPETLRPALRTIVGGVVGRAQEIYRTSMSPGLSPAEVHDLPTRGWSLGDNWAHISKILAEELSGDPVTRDRVLERLINSAEANYRESGEKAA